MAHVAMPPKLSAWVADCIAMFAHDAPEGLRWLAPSVVEYAALPLYVAWWDTIGIRADGEIVSWSTEDELSGYSGARPVGDRYHWLSALVYGSRRYERLKALLSTRPTGAVDCPHLVHLVFAAGKVFAGNAAGWVGSNRPKFDLAVKWTGPAARVVTGEP